MKVYVGHIYTDIYIRTHIRVPNTYVHLHVVNLYVNRNAAHIDVE